ncbi:MAG: hypothetical protein AAGI52_04680 [Bacteroidota bacterium]
MTETPASAHIPDGLREALDGLIGHHGLEAVVGALLEATRAAGTPYGASTPVGKNGRLSGHRPCFHCGANTPVGEVWEAQEEGVLCMVRCGTCGRDYAEFYTIEEEGARLARENARDGNEQGTPPLG